MRKNSSYPTRKGTLFFLISSLSLSRIAIWLAEGYLSVGRLDVLLRHALQEHLLRHEVGRLLALLPVVEPHLVDLA